MDIVPEKVEKINAFKSPIQDDEIERFLSEELIFIVSRTLAVSIMFSQLAGRARRRPSGVFPCRAAAGRGVRLSSGHGSAGPPGSVFGLIRTGWRALPIRFPGPARLRHERLLAAPPEIGRAHV